MPIILTPETEAKLIRFATSRGLAPKEALDIALDELLDENEEQEEDLSTIPDILMKVSPDDLREAQEEMDAGKWVKGADFLAELRSPLVD